MKKIFGAGGIGFAGRALFWDSYVVEKVLAKFFVVRRDNVDKRAFPIPDTAAGVVSLRIAACSPVDFAGFLEL
jgi:hypothetical protein